jgi:signal transduction histidine kinase
VNQADVSVWADKQAIHVLVNDLGSGYNIAKSSHFASTGLLGMRERALLLGGKFDIDSQPGKGTCLTAEIPLSKPSHKK